MRRPTRIGTRGSPLALAQTNEVVTRLKDLNPELRFEVVPIRTRGDKTELTQSGEFDGKSMFTEEIDESLTAGKIDLAVHSMKDLTTEITTGLMIGAVPERADARDVLISRSKTKFDGLAAGARVGTSSPRRRAQLLATRGDLEIIEVNGNVGTRLKKLETGEYDAIILAAAGLSRLGLENHATEHLSTNIMIPAVGQGALAIESCSDDEEMGELLSHIDHKPTRMAVEAERAFARRLGADCRTPVAAFARINRGRITIEGMVAAPTGRMLVRSRLVSYDQEAEKAGVELAEALLDKGAAMILEAA